MSVRPKAYLMPPSIPKLVIVESMVANSFISSVLRTDQTSNAVLVTCLISLYETKSGSRFGMPLREASESCHALRSAKLPRHLGSTALRAYQYLARSEAVFSLLIHGSVKLRLLMDKLSMEYTFSNSSSLTMPPACNLSRILNRLSKSWLSICRLDLMRYNAGAETSTTTFLLLVCMVLNSRISFSTAV